MYMTKAITIISVRITSEAALLHLTQNVGKIHKSITKVHQAVMNLTLVIIFNRIKIMI